MPLSRREMVTILSAAVAAPTAAAAGETAPSLPGRIYHHAAIAYVGDDKKKARQFFKGVEHSGFGLEAHETVLGPGTETHPPHTHEHEEIIIVVEGTVEVTVSGQKEIAETGSVIYYESNRPHGLRNAGTTPCRYYVIELRGKNL
jgi:XRE family transcriptional regulator, regulator of sulfur utilization